MAEKNNDRLFFTCSLIEFIGRRLKRNREEIVDILGKDRLERIYEYADVFHCEPMEKTAETFIEETGAEMAGVDNVGECRYLVPDYWDIGEVYERLIEDCYSDGDILKGIWEVYHSWINASISDFNTDFYYQSRDYIAACYLEGKVL